MKNNNIKIPVNIGVEGVFDIEVVDTLTGKVKSHQKKRNLLTNNLLNAFFTKYQTKLYNGQTWKYVSGSRDYTNFIRRGRLICNVGSGTTPPTRNDYALESELYRIHAELIDISEYSEIDDEPLTVSRHFVFPAGSFTGTVAEVGIVSETAYSSSIGQYCRQILDTPVTINSSDELHVTWTFRYFFGPSTWSGTIENGQRDGTTDINWVLTINKNQKINFLDQSSDSNIFSGRAIGVILGDSNLPSDIINDGISTIQGNALFTSESNASLSTVEPYTPGTYFRDAELGFEHNSPLNVSIGEMIVSKSVGNSASYGGMMRITFDPPLDKATDFRLFITLRISLLPVNGS